MRRSRPKSASARSPACRRHGRSPSRRSSFSRPCSTASPKRSPISGPIPPCTRAWWMTAAASQWYDGLLHIQGRRRGDRGRRHPGARLRRIHRRGVPARFVPEGALLQAARATHRAYTASAPWRASTWPNRCGTPLADRELAEFRQRCGARRSQLVPLPLRAADRASPRTGKDRSAARRSGDPRQARARPRRRQQPGRRRHDRSAARRPDPSLQSG